MISSPALAPLASRRIRASAALVAGGDQIAGGPSCVLALRKVGAPAQLARCCVDGNGSLLTSCRSLLASTSLHNQCHWRRAMSDGMPYVSGPFSARRFAGFGSEPGGFLRSASWFSAAWDSVASRYRPLAVHISGTTLRPTGRRKDDARAWAWSNR